MLWTMTGRGLRNYLAFPFISLDMLQACEVGWYNLGFSPRCASTLPLEESIQLRCNQYLTHLITLSRAATKAGQMAMPSTLLHLMLPTQVPTGFAMLSQLFFL
jgi:hypothetical protein